MVPRRRLEPRPPDLRFVAVDALFPHEQYEDQRLESLVERFKSQKVLKNPPIATPLGGGEEGVDRYMVLDGANRATAARQAGFPHMLVQMVHYEYPNVALSTWNHALVDTERSEFEAALGKIAGLECQSCDLTHARAQVARRDALAFVCYEDDTATALHGRNDLHERNTLLNALVDLYRTNRRFFRESGESFEEAKARHQSVSALVVFPHFEPAEILDLVGAGERLPAGISRHLVQWRALRLNVPLEILADTSQSLEAKNEWLQKWVRDKFAHREVRYYEEPTVLYDE